jgi:hypothetical protein
MAINQSKYFTGNARTPVPHPHRKGEVIEYIFTHIFAVTLATTDILELFPIFPHGRIVGFDFIGEDVGTEALDIGLMSGTPGSLDATRTSTDVLVDGVAANTGAVTSLIELAAIPEVGGTSVSIGVKTATEIAAGSGKKLHVRIRVVS